MSIRTPGADRIQTPHARAEDELDATLRPRRLDDFVGQDALKEQLAVSIAAAAARGDALDHVLLAGPPGLGKTSLARIVAEELGVPFVQTAGPALERKGDIAAFLTDLEPRAVFFVDEIHRLPRARRGDVLPGDGGPPAADHARRGPGARVVTLDLPPFTLVGATTRAGLLTTPLRDRFGIQHRLDHYDAGDLARIVVRSARLLASTIDAAGARAIADRARGTPRVANRLLKRVRDYAEVRGDGVDRRHGGRRGARPARGRPRGPGPARPRVLRDVCERSPAARSGCRRWPSRWARSRTRSRTSTSPTCCSAASSSGRRAAAAPRRTPTGTSGWSRRAERPSL